ncbi:hypothetical protein BDB00DRAFT_803295 [Zychaea mexicana]|uniref:uncharacterized protein n=1 Tax=Zychaea mexicana TaxID=64656 RepID=UPI0022FDD8D0|nr:uncharacterized protein BDB00DRAFT_803295 [Zychaea mexicana]KAI9497587.1 hypothetical protein BDB00DRAFT_803295 [Zychaea mexicana]
MSSNGVVGINNSASDEVVATQKDSKGESRHSVMSVEEEVKHDKGVDFIAALPIELLSWVFAHVPNLQLVECMLVNKNWRTLVGDCREAWREVEVSSSSGTLNNAMFFKVTQAAAGHIHRLELTDPGDQWIQLISECKTLHTLLIKSTRLSSSLLLQNLRKVSPTLKRLQLYIQAVNDDIFVPVWSICTHLTHLALYVNQIRAIEDSFDNLPVLSDLVHLSLHVSVSAMVDMPRKLDSIFRACPNLEYFENGLYPCPTVLLERLRQRLPRLQHLFWKEFPLGAKGWDRSAVSTSEELGSSSLTITTSQRLRTISMLLGARDVSQGYQICSFLAHSRSSLETVEIHGPLGIEPEEFRGWDAFSSLHGDCLRALTLKRLAIDTNTILSLLRQCRSLHAITLDQMPLIQDPFFDALLDLAHLEQLRIIRGCSRLTSDRLTYFLNNIASQSGITGSDNNDNKEQQHAPALKDIHLCSHLISNASLAALANIQSIEKLQLSGNRSLAIGDALEVVARQLTNLVEVRLITISACSDTFMINLSHLKRLERVELLALRQVSNDGVMALANNSSSLKYIAVRVCPMITQEAMTYAQQKNICVRYAKA